MILHLHFTPDPNKFYKTIDHTFFQVWVQEDTPLMAQVVCIDPGLHCQNKILSKEDPLVCESSYVIILSHSWDMNTHGPFDMSRQELMAGAMPQHTVNRCFNSVTILLDGLHCKCKPAFPGNGLYH